MHLRPHGVLPAARLLAPRLALTLACVSFRDGSG